MGRRAPASASRDGPLRVVVGVIGLAAVALGVGYLLQVPLATGTWPFAVTPLTYQFLGALTLAFATPVVWVAWSGEIAALAGIALAIAVAYSVFTLVLLTQLGGQPQLTVNVVLAAATAVLGLAGFVIGIRREEVDRRAMPRLVRAASVVFLLALVVTGGAMLLRVPNILPWQVDLDSQQLVGALFLGSGAFFAFTVTRSLWPHGAAILMAFLVYDVVLILPLVNHAAIVRPEHQVGLVIYLAVVISSAVLAAYQLFLDRRTRILARGEAAAIAPRGA